MAREIPENDRVRLEAMLRTDALPDVVESSYWAFKYLRDAIDAGPLRGEEIVLVAFLAGCRGVAPESIPETIYDRLRKGRFPEGYPIMVQWRNRPIKAEFFAITPLGFTARLSGEGIVREIPADRLAEICDPQPA